jgi:hypothetical protein
MISLHANPVIIQKMKINRFHVVQCPTCRNKYLLGDLSPALYIDMDPRLTRPPDEGGNGYNYYCPKDKTNIYAPRW